jgi:hypothetical protein
MDQYEQLGVKEYSIPGRGISLSLKMYYAWNTGVFWQLHGMACQSLVEILTNTINTSKIETKN